MTVYKHYKPEDIKALRKAIGLTAQELADMVGTTKQTISHVEREKSYSTPLLIALSVVLDDICSEKQIDPAIVIAKYQELKEYVEHNNIKEFIK